MVDCSSAITIPLVPLFKISKASNRKYQTCILNLPSMSVHFPTSQNESSGPGVSHSKAEHTSQDLAPVSKKIEVLVTVDNIT